MISIQLLSHVALDNNDYQRGCRQPWIFELQKAVESLSAWLTGLSQSGTLVRHQYDVTPEGTYDGPTPLVRVDTTCCDPADVRILGLSRTVIESVSWIIVWTYHGEPAGMSLSFFSASSFTNLKIIWIFAPWCVPRQHHRTPWAIDRHKSRAVDEWSWCGSEPHGTPSCTVQGQLWPGEAHVMVDLVMLEDGSRRIANSSAVPLAVPPSPHVVMLLV